MFDPSIPGSSQTATQKLPDFQRPPVVEVAISVHFDELSAFQPVHFGLLWERLRNRYPRTEYHPPVGPTFELFDSKGAPNVGFRFETNLPVGRCWYLSNDGTELLQIQPDRLTINWRKLDTDATYPRYGTLRERLQREIDLLLEFAEEHGLGSFQPLQCEVTYVNHILRGDGWETAADLGNVLAIWSGKTTDSYLPAVEDVRLSCQYRMEEEGAPLGRLHVELQSAKRKSDQRELLALHLVARGAPTKTSKDGVLGFTDRAHEWIVRGFTSVTTPGMHKKWERLT